MAISGKFTTFIKSIHQERGHQCDTAALDDLIPAIAFDDAPETQPNYTTATTRKLAAERKLDGTCSGI